MVLTANQRKQFEKFIAENPHPGEPPEVYMREKTFDVIADSAEWERQRATMNLFNEWVVKNRKHAFTQVLKDLLDDGHVKQDTIDGVILVVAIEHLEPNNLGLFGNLLSFM